MAETWEYQIVCVNATEDAAETLNALVAQGWQLVETEGAVGRGELFVVVQRPVCRAQEHSRPARALGVPA